jgi:hypothetical protein
MAAARDEMQMQPIAIAAQQASDPAIKAAGQGLASAFVAEQGDGPFDLMLRAERAFLAMAEACGDKYGDGPW